MGGKICPYMQFNPSLLTIKLGRVKPTYQLSSLMINLQWTFTLSIFKSKFPIEQTLPFLGLQSPLHLLISSTSLKLPESSAKF